TASISKGRIEDLLTLALEARQPPLVGGIVLQSRILIPPGKTPVRDRLRLEGSFGLPRARFTDKVVQTKLQEFSRRRRGPVKELPPSTTLTRREGKFPLAKSVLSLKPLNFEVPGALVKLDGTYALAKTELDLAGTLRMNATVSQAVGGVKSIFLKPF